MLTRTPSPVLSGVVHQQIPEDPTVTQWDAWWTVVDSKHLGERHARTTRGLTRRQARAS
jgi:hypothetical protein